MNITRDMLARTAAAARQRPRAPENTYRIEGEYLCTRDIAERLCIHVVTAQKRLAKLRGATGAITWARLRGESP